MEGYIQPSLEVLPNGVSSIPAVRRGKAQEDLSKEMQSNFSQESREDFLALDANRIPIEVFLEDDSDLTELSSSEEDTAASSAQILGRKRVKELGGLAGGTWSLK